MHSEQRAPLRSLHGVRDRSHTADGRPPIAAALLVTHAPPHGVLDIVGGVGDKPSGTASATP